MSKNYIKDICEKIDRCIDLTNDEKVQEKLKKSRVFLERLDFSHIEFEEELANWIRFVGFDSRGWGGFEEYPNWDEKRNIWYCDSDFWPANSVDLKCDFTPSANYLIKVENGVLTKRIKFNKTN